jgi:hypothetical protein
VDERDRFLVRLKHGICVMLTDNKMVRAAEIAFPCEIVPTRDRRTVRLICAREVSQLFKCGSNKYTALLRIWYCAESHTHIEEMTGDDSYRPVYSIELAL